MIAVAFLMDLFHKVLLFYAVFLTFVFLLWSLRPVSRFGNAKTLYLLAVVAIPLLWIGLYSVSEKRFIIFSSVNLFFKKLDSDILMRIINEWRSESIVSAARDTYYLTIDSSSSLAVISSSLKIYFYYLLAPFPWMYRCA